MSTPKTIKTLPELLQSFPWIDQDTTNPFDALQTLLENNAEQALITRKEKGSPIYYDYIHARTTSFLKGALALKSSSTTNLFECCASFLGEIRRMMEHERDTLALCTFLYTWSAITDLLKQNGGEEVPKVGQWDGAENLLLDLFFSLPLHEDADDTLSGDHTTMSFPSWHFSLAPSFWKHQLGCMKLRADFVDAALAQWSNPDVNNVMQGASNKLTEPFPITQVRVTHLLKRNQIDEATRLADAQNSVELMMQIADATRDYQNLARLYWRFPCTDLDVSNVAESAFAAGQYLSALVFESKPGKEPKFPFSSKTVSRKWSVLHPIACAHRVPSLIELAASCWASSIGKRSDGTWLETVLETEQQAPSDVVGLLAVALSCEMLATYRARPGDTHGMAAFLKEVKLIPSTWYQFYYIGESEMTDCLTTLLRDGKWLNAKGLIEHRDSIAKQLGKPNLVLKAISRCDFEELRNASRSEEGQQEFWNSVAFIANTDGISPTKFFSVLLEENDKFSVGLTREIIESAIKAHPLHNYDQALIRCRPISQKPQLRLIWFSALHQILQAQAKGTAEFSSSDLRRCCSLLSYVPWSNGLADDLLEIIIHLFSIGEGPSAVSITSNLLRRLSLPHNSLSVHAQACYVAVIAYARFRAQELRLPQADELSNWGSTVTPGAYSQFLIHLLSRTTSDFDLAREYCRLPTPNNGSIVLGTSSIWHSQPALLGAFAKLKPYIIQRDLLRPIQHELCNDCGDKHDVAILETFFEFKSKRDKISDIDRELARLTKHRRRHYGKLLAAIENGGETCLKHVLGLYKRHSAKRGLWDRTPIYVRQAIEDRERLTL